jgi:indole-3-acetate monooxygenase
VIRFLYALIQIIGRGADAVASAFLLTSPTIANERSARMKMESHDATLAQSSREWIERARALKPLLEAAAPRIEQAKDLPSDVRDAMHQAALFRMTLPRAIGGAELDLATYAQVVAAIAEGDASAAWCVAQTAGSSMTAAYVEPRVAKEVFGDPRSTFTFGFTSGQPPCRAVPTKGGWTVNGAWTFGSGNRLCNWLGGHTQLCDESGNPLKTPAGKFVERTMIFPRSAAMVREDLWEVVGLCGTGSDSYSVTNLFVPTEFSAVPRAVGRDQQLPEGVQAEPEPERRERGTLYRFSSQAVFQAGLTSVATGIARAILDAFIDLARKKNPSSAVQSLRDDTWIQARIAQADAKINASHAWVVRLYEEAWEECAATGAVSFPMRVKLRAACTHQMNEAREAADMIFLEAGATAIFKSNAFERRFRDLHTAAQQVQGSVSRMQSVGQYYLGGKPQLFLMA